MQWWVCVVAACALTLCALPWLRARRARRLLASLPAFSQLPLLGSLHHLMDSNNCAGIVLFRILNKMAHLCEVHDRPVVFWVGPVPLVVLHDLEDVKLVTNTFIEKPYFYNFGNLWVGDGLVTAPGHIWKQNIKKLSGLFSGAVVARFQPAFGAHARRLTHRLRAAATAATPTHLRNHLSYTTFETICQTALGMSGMSSSAALEQYYAAFTRAFELIVLRGVNALQHFDCVYRLTPSFREFQKCVDVLHNVSGTALKQRKLYREEIMKNPQLNTEEEFKSVIDIVLGMAAGGRLSEQQARAEVDTLIVGGQETVAATAFFTLLMLARHPHVQDKLYDEIRSIFGDSTRPIEKEDLGQLQYCEAVLHETLRLFPPIPAVMRYADKDLELKSCTIPAGSVVLLSAWGTGRSRRAWGPDAAQYRPERWLQTPARPHAFLAFSYGRRACIGKRYAIANLKTIITYCIREFVFEAEEKELQLKAAPDLRTISGDLLNISLRNKS